ncbi:MAG: hypothetical protein RIM84_26290 [Alphaproteobacteria bacterium]
MSETSLVLVSVVLFARHPDAPVPRVLTALRRQSLIAQAEVLLVDGREAPPSDLPTDFPQLRRIVAEPSNMPMLKARGIAEARGAFVAILDPWDEPDPRWLETIVAGFRDQGIAGVGGAVVPPAAADATNRAAFLFEYGAFNPPMISGPSDGEMPGNNFAVRRDLLLADCRDILRSEGFNKPFCQARLRDRGRVLAMQPEMRVVHLTCHRLWPFLASRFQYARCFGATRLRFVEPGRRTLLRIFAPLVPALLAWRHLHAAATHSGNRVLLRGARAQLVAICLAWGTGEWLGYWLGAGDSCEQLY